jgi:tetratricopeptide (TPR) repeat protein
VSRPTAGKVAMWCGVVLVLIYGLRAGYGWVGGISYSLGSRLAAAGEYEAALVHLQRADVGKVKVRALWLSAEVREGVWQSAFNTDSETPETDGQLALAFRDYTAAIAESPAAGWYWSDLGEVYHDLETAARYDEQLPLGLSQHGPWALVGRPGRIAIGLSRYGLRREPTVYHLHDQLAMLLIKYGLQEAAAVAVANAAISQPLYQLHPFGTMSPTPRWVLDAFAESSRSVLNSTPLVLRTSHLTALARVEIARRNFVQAERDLLEALDAPSTRLNKAEASYYLGVVLVEQERFGEAASTLERSALHPNMQRASLVLLAQIAERTERLDEGLEYLRRLRRLYPRDISYSLRFAKIAVELENWVQAEEAYMWARMIHSKDLRPRRGLIELLILKGDYAEANRELRELARRGAGPAVLDALRSRLQTARESD